jgi:hypothetical protein
MTGPNELGRKYRLSPRPSQSTSYETVAIGGAMFYAGTVLFAMDPVIYLVSVPVPFLFGSVVVLNMLGNTLFARLSQPAKGVLNVLAAIAFEGSLSLVFWVSMPAVSGELPSGPPAYAAQLWLANALLAVTFPFLVIHAAFFHFWPASERRARCRRCCRSARGVGSIAFAPLRDHRFCTSASVHLPLAHRSFSLQTYSSSSQFGCSTM